MQAQNAKSSGCLKKDAADSAGHVLVALGTAAQAPRRYANLRTSTSARQNKGKTSSAWLRPKLGFELRSRKKTGQIGETHSIGERSKFTGQFGDVGGSALRTVDIFADLERFGGLSASGKTPECC
jgi:hypothetical protein